MKHWWRWSEETLNCQGKRVVHQGRDDGTWERQHREVHYAERFDFRPLPVNPDIVEKVHVVCSVCLDCGATSESDGWVALRLPADGIHGPRCDYCNQQPGDGRMCVGCGAPHVLSERKS